MEMIKAIKQLFVKEPSGLADLLANVRNQEELLGMLAPAQPSNEKVLLDANRIVKYSIDHTYQVWAKEAWSQVLSHLDAIQDDKSSNDKVNFHRGALNATLNLLRISYRARFIKDQLDKETAQNVSSTR